MKFKEAEPSKWSYEKLKQLALKFADVFNRKDLMEKACEDIKSSVQSQKKKISGEKLTTLVREQVGGAFFALIVIEELKVMLEEYRAEKKLPEIETASDKDFLDFLLSDTAKKYFGLNSEHPIKSYVTLFKIAISRTLERSLNHATLYKLEIAIDEDLAAEDSVNPGSLTDIDHLINEVIMYAITGQGQLIFEDFLDFKIPAS